MGKTSIRKFVGCGPMPVLGVSGPTKLWQQLSPAIPPNCDSGSLAGEEPRGIPPEISCTRLGTYDERFLLFN